MRNFFLIISLYVMASPVWAAIDCNSVFPGPIQSYADDGTLYMQSGARVEKYNGLEVCFKQVKAYNEEMSTLACGAGKCQVTGVASKKQASPTIPSGTDSTNYQIPSWGKPSQVLLGQTPNYGKAVGSRWDTGPVTVSGDIGTDGLVGSLSVSNIYDTYIIKGLIIHNKGVVTLLAGKTYIIEGDLELISGTIKVTGSGATKIYVKKNLSAHNESQLQAGSDMEVYVGGDLKFTGNNTLAGSFYAENYATLENDVTLLGRVSAKHVELKGNSKVIYAGAQQTLECFDDDFNSSSLKPEWVVKTSSGSFSPSIQDGRLRLTEDKNNQATSLTYLKLFPAANNLVTVEFDHSAYDGSGADGIAMVLSDAKITPQPGAFGGPLGYGHKGSTAPGFAGGWLGVGIDEFGNFSAEGGSNNQPSRKNSIAIRGSGSGTTGYRYLYGSATLSPPIHNGKGYPTFPHRYRLTVDSRSGNKTMVSLERNVGAGYAAVSGISSFDAIKEPGQSPIPENFYLSFTGSTGGSNNKHDIDNVKICALKVNPVGVQVHHFEFSHSGQGITCQPEEVTIKACANADCSQLMSETVTAALTPHPIMNGGWSSGSGLNNVNNGIVTITNGATKVMLSNYSANSITMGVSSSTPPLRPQSDTLCRSGSLGPAKQYCTLPFADAALRFNVPTFYAGASGVTSIRAIKSNDAGATKVCVPLLTGNQTLQFASTKVVSEVSGAVPMVNSTAIAPSGNVKVAFNSDGVGQLTVQYPDAGVLRLDATFQKSDATGTLKLTGSDTVAVIPKAITLQAQGQSACSGNNDSTYAACPFYRKAGESFTLQASAVNTQDQLTPGFATSNKALSWALLAPAAGGTGTFSPSAITLASGIANVTANWSEVGVIQLGVSNFVPYPAYQDESPQLETVQRWSAPIGRFVPWDYRLSGGFITPACNAFTYMSQPFASGFVITARNLQQGTTQNYQGAFAKGVAEMVAANALDGVARDKRITLFPSLSWASGVASVNQQSPLGLNTRFDRAASPEAPFATLSFGIKVDDKDGSNTRLATPNMNAAVAGACSGAGCDAVRLGTQKLLYGRLLAGKDRGVDSANLPLKLLMQRFDLGGWVINDEDNCTQLSLANSGFDPLPAIEPKDPDRKIGFNSVTSSYEVTGKVPPLLIKPYSSTLTLSGQTVPASSARAKQGEIVFHFGAPNVAVRIPYKVDLAKQPSSPTWLSDPTSLQGEARFGSSRGNDRIIYRREVMQ